MRLVIALALVAFGCGKSSPNPTPADCADAGKGIDAIAARAHEQLATAQVSEDVREQTEQSNKKLDALVPRLRAVITSHCVDDKWPADVIECYAKVASFDDMRACRERLSHIQQAKVQRAELAAMEAGALPGLGSAMPPTTPEVTKLQDELRALNTKLAEAAKRVDDAKNAAEQEAAAATLKQIQLEMQQLNAKLDAARARASAGSGTETSAPAP